MRLLRQLLLSALVLFIIFSFLGCEIPGLARDRGRAMERLCRQLGGVPLWFRHGPAVVGFACSLSLPEVWLHDFDFNDPPQPQ